MSIWIIIISIVIGLGRLFIPGHNLSWAGTYEALAHIWVGMLFVWCFQKNDKEIKPMAIYSLVTITAIEAVAFALFKMSN